MYVALVPLYTASSAKPYRVLVAVDVSPVTAVRPSFPLTHTLLVPSYDTGPVTLHTVMLVPVVTQVSVDVEGDIYRLAASSGITLFTVSHRRSLWKHHGVSTVV